MEFNGEEGLEPVSPIGQYFDSSILKIYILAVLEMEVPIHNLRSVWLVQNLFIPINSRFSSIMVTDMNGKKQWQKVEVDVKEHLIFPTFPSGLTPKSFDKYFDDYLSKLAVEKLAPTKPLWEIHAINYATSNAASTIIFKLHHALGDGYSLMGALLSCLQRADNPFVPLTFPSRQSGAKSLSDNRRIFKLVPQFLSSVYNTISDFGWSFLKSTIINDDPSSIRSADFSVDFRPISITTISFSLVHINEIKSKLGVTVNDVLTGAIFLGVRMYMEKVMNGSGKSPLTALVLLNTRDIGVYKSVEDMVKTKKNGKKLWGNSFAFLHIAIPEILMDIKLSNPLEFVMEARKNIQRKRSSYGIHLTAGLLEFMRKIRGPEKTSKLVYNTLKNSSLGITNLIGPIEQMALDGHPIKGLYFMPLGSPLSLVISIMSYMGKVRLGIGAEKNLIDAQELESCINNSFEMVSQATFKSY